MTRTLRFTGEESARFTRFGLLCLDTGSPVRIRVEGREPLTSRAVRIDGEVAGGTLDGYMRFLVVRELGSAVEYWVAGSNSTRSIAATTVEFEIAPELGTALDALIGRGEYVPGLMVTGAPESDWAALERTLEAKSESDLGVLLALLDDATEPTFSREVALALRAFASLATRRRSLQRRMERVLLGHLERAVDVDTRIAIVEDLGYVGSSNSLDPLADLLRSPDEADHVRWAATIALGRLNLRDAAPALLAGASSSHMWTRAAALLALARRAEEGDRAELEAVFVRAMQTDEAVLQRYGCLGLSKFSVVEDETLDLLVEMLENSDYAIGIRGYAALALSSVIASCSGTRRALVETTVSRIEVEVSEEPNEPETVWGLEFLAELATLLELHGDADDLYSELSELFDDWRGPYYEALSLYERGESFVSNPTRDELECYRQALGILRGIDLGQSDDAHQAVAFRIDIVQGRLSLQQALRDWEGTFEPGHLDDLAAELRDVAAVFARYSNASPTAEGVKRLSDREREYLNGTRRLVDVMSNVVLLEAAWRRGGTPPDSLRAIVRNLADVLQVLSGQFAGQLARGPHALAETASRSVGSTLEVLEDGDLPAAQRENALRALTSELRELFRLSTWPMPARACPIGGLGRGALAVIEEDTPGDGTERNPFRFPPSTPPVMNILAEIQEMAPGGATRARVFCHVAGQTLTYQVHAVEGPVRCDFVLPDLSPVASSVCRFELVFEARDCSQTAAALSVYVRSDGHPPPAGSA